MGAVRCTRGSAAKAKNFAKNNSGARAPSSSRADAETLRFCPELKRLARTGRAWPARRPQKTGAPAFEDQ